MTLWWLLGNYPSELRADFQRYYSINLDGMGTDYTVTHAAALAVNLPSDSAVLKAMYPRNGWTTTEYLLHAIEFNLRVLIWQNSKDGQKGTNKPRPLPTPEDEGRVRGKVDATNFELIMQKLGNKGVTHG